MADYCQVLPPLIDYGSIQELMPMHPTIKPCATATEILQTFSVLKQLRPYLDEIQYPSLIEALKREGATLIAAFDAHNQCLGTAIFRIHTLTFLNGEHEMYVDDLVVSESARSQGIGKLLLDWLKAEAQHIGCVGLSLDSANYRVDAHRFYKREGLDNMGGHFRVAFV
jgi:GNAT superfamily N-acetyltransferase